jgi:AcrR family transcriptional regulator
LTELENILEHSSEMYLKYGLRSVSMDDIARSLSISKKTLYQHIGSKQSLVSLIADYLGSVFAMHIKSIGHEVNINDKEHLSFVAIYILTFSQENYRFLKDLERYYHPIWEVFNLKQTNAISKIIEPIYVKLKNKQQIKNTVNKEVFEYILLEACRLRGFSYANEYNREYELKALELLIDGLFKNSEN